jgi:hypothetical protein
MNILTKLRHALLGKSNEPITRLPASDGGALRIDELPPFSLAIADLMRYDPQVRIGLGARNGLLMAAEVEVTGPDAKTVRWVQQQWDALWHGFAHQLLRAKLYGFLPFEVSYRAASAGEFAGMLEVENLHDYHPRDVRLLMQEERIVGFAKEVRNADEEMRNSEFGMRNEGKEYETGYDSSSTSHSELRIPHSYFSPAALVCTFDAECDNPYGCALLARAYPAWHEKWMPGGAKRTLQLRMHAVTAAAVAVPLIERATI